MRITPEKRNVAVLAASQALFMTGATILVILSGLAGLDLAEDKALATLPVSALMIGNALTMIYTAPGASCECANHRYATHLITKILSPK